MIQPKIVIVDYAVGNTYSVLNALKSLGYSRIKISASKNDINDADALVLPGVGAFDACMDNLLERKLDEILYEAVQIRIKPILGICVGMQLFSTLSEENGEHMGLNWIPGRVIRLLPAGGLSVPHVGWNNLVICNPTEMFSTLKEAPHFYFDHSYHYDCAESYINARCEYGGLITAAISNNNIHGVQFHPEKSQKNGLKLFGDFLIGLGSVKKKNSWIIGCEEWGGCPSVGFNRYLPVGRPEVSVEFLNEWGIDEIILLDMTATANEHPPDLNMVKRVSSFCQVPLTVGGGIHEIKNVIELMNSGADKVAFDSAIFKQPALLSEAAKKFGEQAIVASIDAYLTEDGYKVFNYLEDSQGYEDTPADLAIKLKSYGAGEILINSVDRDGSYTGFDLALIKSICASVDIPVICSGGAGKAEHFVEVFERTNVCAAAAANYFHFTEHSVAITKALVGQSIQIRGDIEFDYKDALFDSGDRLLKKPDAQLEELLYVKIEKDII